MARNIRELGLGAKLENARKSVDLTQEQLADRYRQATGRTTTNRTIFKWFRGAMDPRLTEYNDLAEVVNDLGAQRGLPPLLEVVNLSVESTDGGGDVVSLPLKRPVVAPTGFDAVIAA